MIPSLSTLGKAAQGQRGTGFQHAPLPPGTPHLRELIGTGSAALPPNASVRSDLVLPKNQGPSDSCVGQSNAQAYRIACLARGIPCPDLSALSNYAWGRASIGLQGQDVGMTLPAGLTAAQRFGIATEEAWPFSILNINRNPSATALHSAYDQRGLRGYYYVDGDDDAGVRRALSNRLPLIGAWPVDAYFFLDSEPELIDAPTGQIKGWHSMVVEDYRADGTFGLLNHYGQSWRSGGRCRFTTAYLKKSQGFIACDVQK